MKLKPEHRVEIISCDNGWLVNEYSWFDEDMAGVDRTVIEGDGLESIVAVLYAVKCAMGYNYCKHDKENIQIRTVSIENEIDEDN